MKKNTNILHKAENSITDHAEYFAHHHPTFTYFFTFMGIPVLALTGVFLGSELLLKPVTAFISWL